MSIEARALKWALGGDTGASSEAICAHMTGSKPEAWSYPSDPADLGRCLRLLDGFPEWKSRISEMATYGSGWSGLAKRWHDLTASMESEVGIFWEKGTSAPKTFEMMQIAIADGFRSDSNYRCEFSESGYLRYAERVASAHS